MAVMYQRGSYMREALCNICTTFLIVSNGLGGNFNHTLMASMTCSRTPLDGNELTYVKGSSTI